MPKLINHCIEEIGEIFPECRCQKTKTTNQLGLICFQSGFGHRPGRLLSISAPGIQTPPRARATATCWGSALDELQTKSLPGLPYNPWIGSVLANVGPDGLPKLLEYTGTSGEMQSGKGGAEKHTRNVGRLQTPDWSSLLGGNPAASTFPWWQLLNKSAFRQVSKPPYYPSKRGAPGGRFPAIDVKLNGVTARTNPFQGRYSTGSRLFWMIPAEMVHFFHVFGVEPIEVSHFSHRQFQPEDGFTLPQHGGCVHFAR